MYSTRKILLPELRIVNMQQNDFADYGWFVVFIDGDNETVIDWFADHCAAEEEVNRLNYEEQ
jgi:hypothetical protein